MQSSGKKEKTPVQPDRLRRVEQLFNECRMQKRLPERKKVHKDSEEVPGSVSGAFSGRENRSGITTVVLFCWAW